MSNIYNNWLHPHLDTQTSEQSVPFVTQIVENRTPEGKYFGRNRIDIFKNVMMIDTCYNIDQPLEKKQDVDMGSQTLDIILFRGRNGLFRHPGSDGYMPFEERRVLLTNITCTRPHEVQFGANSELHMSHAALTHRQLSALVDAYPQQLEQLMKIIEHLDDDVILGDYAKQMTVMQQNSLAAIFAPHIMGNSAESFILDNMMQYLGSLFPTVRASKAISKVRYDYNLRNKIREAKEIIDTDIQRPLSLRDLALAVGTNEHYLKAGFKHEYGITVFGYLYECRMRAALQLLKTLNLPVDQIAAIVGYNDSTAFYTAFRRRFGVTPNQYRLR